MRIWTVHEVEVWDALREQGALMIDGAKMSDGYVPQQYCWLAERMRQRIPAHSGGLPWFGYVEKPDLRWVRHRYNRESAHVRIELELDDLVVFPFWAWDRIYCRQYVAFSENELMGVESREMQYDQEWEEFPVDLRGEIESSWERLFDPQLPAAGRSSLGEKPVGYREAAFEILRLGDVRKVDHFFGAAKLCSA